MTTPALTIIRQPFEQMGHAAIELLIERMEHPSTDPVPATHRVLPVELVVRQSTAELKAKS